MLLVSQLLYLDESFKSLDSGEAFQERSNNPRPTSKPKELRAEWTNEAVAVSPRKCKHDGRLNDMYSKGDRQKSESQAFKPFPKLAVAHENVAIDERICFEGVGQSKSIDP